MSDSVGQEYERTAFNVNTSSSRRAIRTVSFPPLSLESWLLMNLRFWLEAAMSTLPGHDHTSSSTPSLDGKGGTDSSAEAGKSTRRTGLSYVYYRLYTKLGAFQSIHPIYHNDHLIGRIPTKSFPPPHTVTSIKRSLCKFEGLLGPDKALVFAPLSSPASRENSARISLNAPSGPGLSEHDPIALVVESEKRTKEVSQSEIYYRVYLSEGEGEEKAKTSFDESDISLGRIDTLFIAPPLTAGSLKAHIAKVEGLVTPGHALYKDMELFQDTNSDAAMSDSDIISFEHDTYPGSDEGDPVALVNAAANTATDQKTKRTPGKVRGEHPLYTAATNCAFQGGPAPKLMKPARILYTNARYEVNKHTWLSVIQDEIVHTDGVVVSMINWIDNRYYPAYMAINSKGEKGFVEQAPMPCGWAHDKGVPDIFFLRSFWLETAMSTLPGHDHTSSFTPSLDGRGGVESASKDGKSMKRTGPNYGAFESIHPLYHNDRFIGRIPTKSFAPPHTVASIRRSLCKLEGLSGPDKALVFTPLSSPAPKENSARLFLSAPSGPGLSEQDPIALVVESERRSEEVSQSEKLPERTDDTDIHYGKSCRSLLHKYYTHQLCSSDISLGRINTLFIAPPHTGSLKAHIAKVEGLVTPGHAHYKDMELFQDTNSDAGMNDTDVMSFQGDAYPGSAEGDHVALVNATANRAADQKAKPTPGNVLGEYPLDTAATNRAFSDEPDSKFTKRARAKGVHWWPGYMAINSKGEKGFVYKDFIAFD
ncbi:uncharacterized protein LACBIDRAFT_328177 [Laccaria bicolor S238N-H82]|uniref:Predicted protein n=1 Tax=Laccaria bicolor (strain S238N-H82 / ATCC MYA-4686) TaxID=486041 RepID=B0DDZ7_LACBS|nr:uncharacterized protein LACBIDRAFT_328177 [Laccaria bicolor S238N-H82]EDR07304.1 predicted protein [Laccaria bicolor S238N-H82]|eukprot:XP_001882235.1 predicted protein [Laccaria bicolor S238N-H82]